MAQQPSLRTTLRLARLRFGPYQMIQFECPQCATSIRVKDEAAGRRGQCKNCDAVITVPDVQTKTSEPQQVGGRDWLPPPLPPGAADEWDVADPWDAEEPAVPDEPPETGRPKKKRRKRKSATRWKYAGRSLTSFYITALVAIVTQRVVAASIVGIIPLLVFGLGNHRILLFVGALGSLAIVCGAMYRMWSLREHLPIWALLLAFYSIAIAFALAGIAAGGTQSSLTAAMGLFQTGMLLAAIASLLCIPVTMMGWIDSLFAPAPAQRFAAIGIISMMTAVGSLVAGIILGSRPAPAIVAVSLGIGGITGLFGTFLCFVFYLRAIVAEVLGEKYVTHINEYMWTAIVCACISAIIMALPYLAEPRVRAQLAPLAALPCLALGIHVNSLLFDNLGTLRERLDRMLNS